MEAICSASRFSLDELTAIGRDLAHRLALDEGESRRVQWEPQPRLIRYYTTIGLLSRPLEKRGKMVYYGWIHLVQLLSIKRLQSLGLGLAEIQSQLLGASLEQMLEDLDLPQDWQMGIPQASPIGPDSGESNEKTDRGRDFWLQPDSPPVPKNDRIQTQPTVRLSLSNGIEIYVPWELWQKAQPDQWQAWSENSPLVLNDHTPRRNTDEGHRDPSPRKP